jgi:uncharacterized protein (DUF433 family)
MQLEDYFEFEKFETPHGPVERIRIKGHRISIENVIGFYNQGASAEEIVKVHYPSLSLEKVYATLAYYLHNKEAVDTYIKEGEKIEDAYYQEWLRTHKPSPVEEKLKSLRAGPQDTKQESA